MAGQKREMFVGGSVRRREREKVLEEREYKPGSTIFGILSGDDLICDTVRRERMNDRDDRQWRRGRNN